ncbi:diguanylate cyclase [Effusibacillus pohliae]|uniref:diguanylate cyclase n=1 Tax=Effusibacillus pohliae TaxID=232270 RepID=UPI000377DA0D|nr:diguanylate cyclase [Effusibacillus pohliae]
MLKQVELRIANLLFRILTQTKPVERLLHKVMQLGVPVLQAEGACLFVAEKWTCQLVLHSNSIIGTHRQAPVSSRELAELCNQRDSFWVEQDGNLYIPLYAGGMLQAVLCFLGVSAVLQGKTVAVANRLVKQLADLYESRKILQDKDQYHAALVDISQAITQTSSFDDVITRAMRMASEAAGAACGIMLLSKDEQSLVPVYTYTIKRSDCKPISFPPPHGLDQTSYLAIQRRKVMLVRDALTDPFSDHEFCRQHGIESYMALPLVIFDRPIGVLFVNYRYKRCFTELEIGFFRELGYQISHVIHTLQTRLEMLETKHMQDRLIEMMREMTNRIRLRDVLHDMVLKTYFLLDKKVGVSVWLVDAARDCIRLSAWKGIKLRQRGKKRTEFSLLEVGNTARLQDRYLEVEGRSEMGQFFLRAGVARSLGTPLMAENDLIGILFLHGPSGHEWTDREKVTLSTIGIHAGPIIRNGQYIQLLEKESKLDGLTKVYNRQHFEKTYREYSAKHVAQQKPFSVLMVDIDNFKQINDQYGHTAGDQVMRLVAATLLQVTRGADKVFRYGGEEFCILLPFTGKKQAEQVAERIRASIERSEIDPPVTVSIGVAAFPENSDDPKQVLELADLALYEAKSKGKNRVIGAV